MRVSTLLGGVMDCGIPEGVWAAAHCPAPRPIEASAAINVPTKRARAVGFIMVLPFDFIGGASSACGYGTNAATRSTNQNAASTAPAECRPARRRRRQRPISRAPMDWNSQLVLGSPTQL